MRFIVTKHAIGTIIEPPEQHADGGWSFHSSQVIAVRRDGNEPPTPTTLSKSEINKQRREWLLADPKRIEADFKPIAHPVRDPRGFEYVDETVYVTWSMS